MSEEPKSTPEPKAPKSKAAKPGVEKPKAAKPKAATPKVATAKAPGASAATSAIAPVRVGAPRAIGDLMPAVGDKAFRKFGFIQSSVVTRWAEIAGERYAAVSTPEALQFPRGTKSGGTLHLTVSSAYAPMMQHVLPELIDRVNRFFGYAAVARIRLVQGHVTPPATRLANAQRGTPPVLRAVPKDIGDSLREITDPELRAVLENLAKGMVGDNPPKIR